MRNEQFLLEVIGPFCHPCGERAKWEGDLRLSSVIVLAQSGLSKIVSPIVYVWYAEAFSLFPTIISN